MELKQRTHRPLSTIENRTNIKKDDGVYTV